MIFGRYSSNTKHGSFGEGKWRTQQPTDYQKEQIRTSHIYPVFFYFQFSYASKNRFDRQVGR